MPHNRAVESPLILVRIAVSQRLNLFVRSLGTPDKGAERLRSRRGDARELVVAVA
jgi:hypothetical protein